MKADVTTDVTDGCPIRSAAPMPVAHPAAKLRAAATLALVEEEPYEEIANALGISVGAVKSRVFRAVRLLQTKLKGLGVES